MKNTGQSASRTMKITSFLSRTAACLAKAPLDAMRKVNAPEGADFVEPSTSAPPAESNRSRPHRHVKNNRASEAAFAAAATGAIIGGTWGWITGIGALTIPGVSLFLTMGPIICAMGGVAIGAALGGVFGGLIGKGIPVIEVGRCEGKFLNGEVLIPVPTGNVGETYRVEQTFDGTRAGHVRDFDSRYHDNPETDNS